MFEHFKFFITNKEFLLNLSMHALILFSFISIFFYFYVATLTKTVFNNEIIHLIESSFSEKIDKLKENKYINKLIDILPIEKLKKIYKNPDPVIAVRNNNLFNTILFINIFCWLIYITIVLVLQNGCDTKIDMKGMIIENLIMFIFIGIVEYLFFTRIAIKYVPVKPSFITSQLFTKIKNSLE